MSVGVNSKKAVETHFDWPYLLWSVSSRARAGILNDWKDDVGL